MAVLEALAAGVPVVASAVGGIPQLGADAVELVAPQRADALAAGVRRVLDDPARRTPWSPPAASSCDERFSSSRMQSEYADVYEARNKGARRS